MVCIYPFSSYFTLWCYEIQRVTYENSDHINTEINVRHFYRRQFQRQFLGVFFILVRFEHWHLSLESLQKHRKDQNCCVICVHTGALWLIQVTVHVYIWHHIDGLVYEIRNSSALAMARWRLKSPALFTQPFIRRSKKHQSSVSLAFDRWIPAQMVSNAENISIWWRHHEPIDMK